MKELDLEVAGEFILMAATLIQIKVRMLLPKSEYEEEVEEEDPRAELVRQILEYKRFKEISESLADMEDHQRRLFTRSWFQWTKQYKKDEGISAEELLMDVTLFDLLSAFKSVLENMPKETVHHVATVGVTIEERIDFLLNQLSEKNRINFRELMVQLKERVTIVVTFMAILELIRTHRIRVQQESAFGEIWIVKQ